MPYLNHTLIPFIFIIQELKMSEFKDYLRAGVLTSLIEKAFLSGKHSQSFAIKILTFLGVFWILKKLALGIFSVIFFPWNRAPDKTFRGLKKVANEMVATGKPLNSIQKNMDWNGEKWHYLSVSNGRGRNKITEISFFVHAKSGRIRIFIHPEFHDFLELTWGDLRSLAGIRENCNLQIANLSEIYQKMYLNIL